MAKCNIHIGSDSFEWCWQCQELTDKERFSSFQTIKKPKEMKVIFLDNDGVICLSNNWGGRSKKRAKYRSANPESTKFMDYPVEVIESAFKTKGENDA